MNKSAPPTAALPIADCLWCDPRLVIVAPRVNTADGTMYWVFCPDCGMHGPAGTSEQVAVARWNFVSGRAPAVQATADADGVCHVPNMDVAIQAMSDEDFKHWNQQCGKNHYAALLKAAWNAICIATDDTGEVDAELTNMFCSKLFQKFLSQGFWHAHHVDLVWRMDGKDVREEADWLKDVWYYIRGKHSTVCPKAAPEYLPVPAFLHRTKDDGLTDSTLSGELDFPAAVSGDKQEKERG